MADENRAEQAVRSRQNVLQGFLDVALFVRERDDADDRALPHIVVIELRHRHVEMTAQTVLQAAEHLPLVLQRLRIGDVQLEGEQADWHGRLRTQAEGYRREAGALICAAASRDRKSTRLNSSH